MNLTLRLHIFGILSINDWLAKFQSSKCPQFAELTLFDNSFSMVVYSGAIKMAQGVGDGTGSADRNEYAENSTAAASSTTTTCWLAMANANANGGDGDGGA